MVESRIQRTEVVALEELMPLLCVGSAFSLDVLDLQSESGFVEVVVKPDCLSGNREKNSQNMFVELRPQ